ncbi:MAG: nucleoside-diphosphate kinase [Cyanobacteria bacterium SIG30]|nr:nucleoside-diphosphate kinase [Cyanobacteria bacterium SIG30]
MERTFVAIKPDGVKRGLVGEILQIFEKRAYRIVALKILNVTDEQAQKHYEEHIGKPFYPGLIDYITSGPIVAMVLEGENIVNEARRIMGSTDPNKAEIGTIRATYAQIMQRNIIHGSDSVESAKREMSIYFDESELCE